MANTSTVQVVHSLSLESGFPVSCNTSKTRTMTGADAVCQTQSIGTSAFEIISKGDIGTVARVTIKNNDATNFVTYAGDEAATVPWKLNAGEAVTLTLHGTAMPWAKADTGAVTISVIVEEE